MNKYSLVIPVYNDEDNLRLLLEDIYGNLSPDDINIAEIIIVDDCSIDDSANRGAMYNSKYLPVKTIELSTHQGPLIAESTGIEACSKSPYIVVCHSDTRLYHPKFPGLIHKNKTLLQGEKTYKKSRGRMGAPAMSNRPLDELVNYLTQYEDAAVIAPYVLCTEVPSTKSHAKYNQNWVICDAEHAPYSRGLGSEQLDEAGIKIPNWVPHRIQRRKRFMPIRILPWERFKAVWSVHNKCFALRREDYYKAGKYDSFYGPYGLYHDDFFRRCYSLEKKVYISSDIIVYHPIHIKGKPDKQGDLAIPPKNISKQVAKFVETYKESELGNDGQVVKQISATNNFRLF